MFTAETRLEIAAIANDLELNRKRCWRSPRWRAAARA
jgi:hypothetical protein